MVVAEGHRESTGASAIRRTLILAVAASVLGEAMILLVFGVVLYPEGDLLTKFLWTIVFCGVGMGSAVGAIVALFVVGRLQGVAAIASTSLTSAVVLGGACNVLCHRLDSHHFHYFGGDENSALFLWSGAAMAALGGAGVGWLLFSPRGAAFVERLGL